MCMLFREMVHCNTWLSYLSGKTSSFLELWSTLALGLGLELRLWCRMYRMFSFKHKQVTHVTAGKVLHVITQPVVEWLSKYGTYYGIEVENYWIVSGNRWQPLHAFQIYDKRFGPEGLRLFWKLDKDLLYDCIRMYKLLLSSFFNKPMVTLQPSTRWHTFLKSR